MNAGAALMPDRVVSAVSDYFDLEVQIGGYSAAERAADQLTSVYDSVAALISASRDEIALTENATVAWQMAFYSLTFNAGDRILTGEAEYAANYVAYLHVAQRTGAIVEVVPSDQDGQIDVAALESMIDDRVRLISLTWMPTNGGLVNPAAEVGEIASRHGIFYLLDACQAVGQWQVDVDALHCDALTGTGRKFLRGPRGTGFLYVRKAVLPELHPPIIDHFSAPWTTLDGYTLRDDARRFETWENAYSLRAGLGAAVDLALEIGMDRIQQRCALLAGRQDWPDPHYVDRGNCRQRPGAGAHAADHRDSVCMGAAPDRGDHRRTHRVLLRTAAIADDAALPRPDSHNGSFGRVQPRCHAHG